MVCLLFYPLILISELIILEEFVSERANQSRTKKLKGKLKGIHSATSKTTKLIPVKEIDEAKEQDLFQIDNLPIIYNRGDYKVEALSI